MLPCTLRLGWLVLPKVKWRSESAGWKVIAVNAATLLRGNRVSREAFRCLACCHRAHADVNATRNILRAWLALQEASKAT